MSWAPNAIQTVRSQVSVESEPLEATTPAEVTDLPPLRREERLDVVRRVDYAPYPRARTAQSERIGFTRDLSASGMCLRIDVAEPVGSLLRLMQSELDGRPGRESIARVVWSSPTVDGGCWVGLALIEPRRPKRVGPISRVA
jgi:hypothetical protein